MRMRFIINAALIGAVSAVVLTGCNAAANKIIRMEWNVLMRLIMIRQPDILNRRLRLIRIIRHIW